MSSILYYSNYCQHSKSILNVLGKSQISQQIHYICIDRRVNKNNKMFIVLENGQEILLPPLITKVPSLLLLNQSHKVIHGNEILQHLNPVETEIKQVATNNNMEPNSYSLGVDSGSLFGVSSDNYSFLDMTSDELSAKGNGGLRQMYNYSNINTDDKIETPKDDYEPDKIKELNMDELHRNRESDIKQTQYVNK